MKFIKLGLKAPKEIQLGAGIILSGVDSFEPDTATAKEDKIFGTTSGGVSFTAIPTFSDFGEDLDNCPKNMKEFKRFESWEAKMSGTFKTLSKETAKILVALADLDSGSGKITPRNVLKDTDFSDLWWVGDYSDKNTGETAGFIAIHLMNALSTSGFSLKSNDKSKGEFAFEFTGHYSIGSQETPPFEIWVKPGTEGT